MDFSKWIGLMPQDDKIYTFDLQKVETTGQKGPKATQTSFQISAIQGEYCAHGENNGEDNGFLKVSFRERSLSIKAHPYLIGAIAFHPKLPILATYNDKEVKIWYIPSELSSNPVLISILKVPESTVFSIAFHPKFPIVFIGKANGDIEVWMAN
jgi:WD40 repeat protein